MNLVNYTAIGSYIAYWLKLVLGLIAFVRGDFKVAGVILLVGSLIEILLYYYTMRH